MKSARSRYENVTPFVTKDGSVIREMMHPASHAVVRQSLAEATVECGATTLRHVHRESEEIYYITHGAGRMEMGAEVFDVTAGDSIVIAPGTPHRITNIGRMPLRILCASSPAYSHDDTELV
jgi:mannose-6-phosphate isomerase-like protein (cupin superfamily)